MSEIIVRPAKESDFKAIQDIQIAGGEALITNDEPIELIDMENGIKDKDVILAVAEEHEKIIGFIHGTIMNTRWAGAHYFAVLPDFRGTDAYKLLGQYFIDVSKEKGVKYIILYADSDNKKLQMFYNRFGFETGGTYTEMIKEI